ncbi:hypothetical protein V7101_19870 [Bacillus velezensis]|uniref:hypothetical protein n=1 Tax=Bacillus velezensis TaxID=492670 RepID=UPI0030008CBC
MRKLQYFILVMISIGSIMIFSTPSEAATGNKELRDGKEISRNISTKLKGLQQEIKKLNGEKDRLNQQIKELYPKKKKLLVQQLKELEKSNYSRNNQDKLNKIQSKIDVYKEAISINKQLKSERKVLWESYKKQMGNENIKGAYQTLKRIRQNLESTILNSREFLKSLTAD